jgi:hypothetical protein
MTGNVINDRLDHMRQNPNRYHSRYCGAPQIMMHPWGNRLAAVGLGNGDIKQPLFEAIRLSGKNGLATIASLWL